MSLFKGTTPIIAAYKGINLAQFYVGTNPVGVNVFVDSVGGSDANDGKTSLTAKQTIAGVTLASGQIINLKRGSKWREQLDISAYTGMRVTDYGSGVLPILDCSDVIPNSGWTQPNVGTYPNVWQVTVNSGALIATMWASIWVNNVRLKFVNGIAAVNPTAGTFTVLGSSTGAYGATTTTLQIYSTTNPNSDGKTYEYAARNYGCATGSGHVVQNIHTRRNAHNNGSYISATNVQTTGCIFEDGSKHNAYCSPGSVMTNCIAWKCDWQAAERDGWIGIVAHTPTATGVETATFIGCQVVVEKATLDSLLNGITGFYCHTSGDPGNLWGRVTYQDCSASYCQSAFSANDCLGVTHIRTHVKNCTGGITCPDGNTDGTNGTNKTAVNILTDCWVEEGDAEMVQRSLLPGGASTTIDGLRVWLLTGNDDGMLYGFANSVTIRRSVFTRGTPGTNYMQYIRMPSVTNCLFQNNVLWGPNTGFGESLIWIGNASMDHNAYAGGNSDMAVNGLSSKLAAYMTAAQAAGSEVGSVSYATGDPFTNSAAGDFSLKVASGLDPSTFGLQRFPTYNTLLTTAAIAAM